MSVSGVFVSVNVVWSKSELLETTHVRVRGSLFGWCVRGGQLLPAGVWALCTYVS